MKLLAIPGSLRKASINAAFCRAAAQLCPREMQMSVYAGLGDLPIFNPDCTADPPPPVVALQRAVEDADALLIASPEYARGVSGPMKNALDWLVSFEGFVAKPVAVVNTSPRAHHAFEALHGTLHTMSAILIAEASVTIALLGNCTTTEAMVGSEEVAGQIRKVLAAIARFREQQGAP